MVAVPARGGRPARTAKVRLAAAAVTVRPPQNAPHLRDGPRLPVWLIRVWEGEPPEGVEALEWVLLCSVPTRSRRELLERRDWYACRPTAEDYHKVEKSGCGQEGLRLRTFGRLQPMLALLSVVAVRVLQLRRALDTAPEAPAEQAGTAAEVGVVARVSGREASSLTVRGFVVEVAKLGGFLGRRGDGPPGWQTLWRGYQRLQDLVWGQELGRQNKHPPG